MRKVTHYVLGNFGPDTDLKRWGWQMDAHGGRTRRNEPSWLWSVSWRCCSIICGAMATSMSRYGIVRQPGRSVLPCSATKAVNRNGSRTADGLGDREVAAERHERNLEHAPVRD